MFLVSFTPSGYELQGLLQNRNSPSPSKNVQDLTPASALLVFTLFFSVVQNLQITKSTRVSVYGILLLGAIDIGFSITRFLIIQLSNVHEFRSITLIGMSFPFSFPMLQNIDLRHRTAINLCSYHLIY